jgi:serine/threonine-protein kinase
MYERDYDEAAEYCQRWDDSAAIMKATKLSISAWVVFMRDGPEAAREPLEEANRVLKELLEESPSYQIVRYMYSLGLAGLGQSAAAAREAKLNADLVAQDKFSGPMALEDLAVVYAMVGRHEDAIDILERLLKTTYEDPITPVVLEIHPNWDPLRDNPRFQKLLEQGS